MAQNATLVFPPSALRRHAAACLGVALALLAWPGEVASQTEDTTGLCDRWAAIAAAEHGVPERLMLAIARVETGRPRQDGTVPWPWAINADGAGRWFPTRDAALRHAEARLAAGAEQLDLGCFQINLRWHGRAFDTLDQMLDPARNARYAARFLAALHDETGDWTAAAAAYHSRTSDHARAYLERLSIVLAQLPGSRLVAPTGRGSTGRQERAATTPHPAFDAGGAALAARAGSLVPLSGATPARRLIDLGGGARR